MKEPTVVVGNVIKAHGVKGEVTVMVLSETPNRFEAGASLWLEGGHELTVRAARPDRGRLLVSFEGVDDRAAAEAMRGRFLVVPQSMLPDLPEGSFWPHELEGCRVVTQDGDDLGEIVDVAQNPAHDLWVAVTDDGSEMFLPAIAEVVVEVDVPRKRVVVREIPGLTVRDTEGEAEPSRSPSGRELPRE